MKEAKKGGGRLTETHFLQEAADITGRVAERVGAMSPLEQTLEQADLPVRASEVLFLYVAGLLFVLIAGLLLIGDPIIVVLVVAVLALIPIGVLRMRRRRRLRSFETQLPDVLHLIAGALRAGFSFMQALESVTREVGEPAHKELSRVVTETQLGRAPEDALADSATRMSSGDLTWAVMAVRIQREVGGNLAEILDKISHTIRERFTIERQIRVYTAQGRFTGYLLAGLPIIVGFLIYMLNSEYIMILFQRPIGRMMIAVAAILQITGFFIIRRIINIEI